MGRIAYSWKLSIVGVCVVSSSLYKAFLFSCEQRVKAVCTSPDPV